ncbi:hypothetical protein, partial [Streptomyces sp. NPDC096030]|uniref:hypothetical protein n=1 Tax=Streptomyces sp. NPDC096030 TaxID=3155423 RepID=UPI00332D3E17
LITLAATALAPVSIGTFIALGGAVLDVASGVLDAVAMGTGRNQLEDPLNIAAITLGAAGLATGIAGAAVHGARKAATNSPGSPISPYEGSPRSSFEDQTRPPKKKGPFPYSSSSEDSDSAVDILNTPVKTTAETVETPTGSVVLEEYLAKAYEASRVHHKWIRRWLEFTDDQHSRYKAVEIVTGMDDAKFFAQEARRDIIKLANDEMGPLGSYAPKTKKTIIRSANDNIEAVEKLHGDALKRGMGGGVIPQISRQMRELQNDVS